MSWTTVKLGDICTIEKGQTGIQKAIPGSYPLVVTSEERKSHNEFQFDDEAVIIPLVSGTGHGHASIKRLHYQKGKFALGSILCAVIPKDKMILNSEYLFRFLELNKENELVARMRGMANVTLPMKEIAKIEIPLPPLKEQIAFVNSYKILAEKNSLLIAEFNKQLNITKQLRQSFLREAMQGKLLKLKHIEGQETGRKLLEKLKADKYNLMSQKKSKKERRTLPIRKDEITFEIPSHWNWCRLGDVFEIVRGSSPRPKGDPRYWSKERTNYHWITIADFTPFGLNGQLIDTTGFLTKEGSTKSRIVKKGDLLVACSGVGSVGRSIQTNIEGFIYDGLLAIRNINNESLRELVRYFLIYKEAQIYSVASGANWLNINIDILSNYIFAIPPVNEQRQIVAKLDELMAFCDGLDQSIKESQVYNDMLLQQVLREALQPKEETFLDIDSLFEDDKNYNLHVAMIQTLIESELGINHGEVANQKTIFHINTFTDEKIPYQFVNYHFGTFSQQLRDDFNKNPYLTKTSKNNKDVFVVKPSKQKEVLDSIYKPENKNFVNAVKEILDIYQLPSINKETDKIELLNTVSKVIQDHQSIDIEVVYQGMKDWKINQGDYKCKADKFNKSEVGRMIKLIENKRLLGKLLNT